MKTVRKKAPKTLHFEYSLLLAKLGVLSSNLRLYFCTGKTKYQNVVAVLASLTLLYSCALLLRNIFLIQDEVGSCLEVNNKTHNERDPLYFMQSCSAYFNLPVSKKLENYISRCVE